MRRQRQTSQIVLSPGNHLGANRVPGSRSGTEDAKRSKMQHLSSGPTVCGRKQKNMGQ